MTFGLTTTTSSYTVDTGAGVVFSVLRGGTVSSTIHLGDLTSVKYNGTETLATYAQTSRYSHYEQGLGSIAVISATVDPNGQWIKITCDDSAETSGGVIQYYVAKKGDPTLYMASLPTDVTNGPGEGRFIAYMSRPVLPNIEDPSDISTTNATVEGSDVFYNTSTGITKSKFYNTRKMIDNIYHGVTGTGIGAFMFMGNRERSSGGPFFKDIDFQTTSAYSSEMYDCLFTGHTQTEAYRQGLQGPYAMQFTNGSAPVTPDYSFLEGVGISGLVPASGRGTISGTASGVPTGHASVVTLSNTSAQYWATANPTTGAYSITGVLPGTYTQTIYDTELAVGTRTVTISAGATTRTNIADTYYSPASTWHIGTWDGTPQGFLNADKIAIMHPSDSRMTPFVSSNFVIGTNTDADWPLAQFMDVNNGQRITFNLTAAQASVAQTLRIGITEGFSGGRNRVTVNSGQTYAWTSAIPAASTDLNSRGITRGTYRGPNQLYTYSIPTSALKAGTNTIDLPVVSGSYVAGQGFLSPNVAYDAIDLVPTSSITNAPVVTTLSITPSNPTLPVSAQAAFTATARDQFGNVMPANAVWSTSGGTIDDTGAFTAPASTGTSTITATVGSVTATTTVTAIVGTPPTVATAAAGSPNPVTGTTTALSVLGADDGGEATLTYTWSATGPGAVSFSANGTNASKNSVATFTQAGTYTFTVTLTDSQNLTKTSTVSVTVNQTFTSIKPAGNNMVAGTFLQISTADQFGQAMSAPAAWTATAGAITSAGVYTAPASGSTSTVITGTVAGTAKTATVTLISPSAWYKADQTAGPGLTDSSGNNKTGTAGGSYSFGTGAIGNALHLTGGSAALPAGIVNGVADFTIAAWIKIDTLANWARIFDFGTGTSKYMFLSPDAGGTNALRFAITTAGGSGEQQLNGPAITAGAWTHVAVTLTGTTGTLYVNGVAVATNTAMTLHPSSLGSPNLNYIGKSQFTADPNLQGYVDDFRIFTTGLSAGGVASLYSTTQHTPSVATAAAASPSPVTGATTNLSVLGSEFAGESNLSYTWSATGPAPVTYTINGTNAAKNSVATFTATGIYTFTVTVTDPYGYITTSSVSVTVPVPAWLGAGSVATWNPSTKVLTVTGSASIVADPGSDEPIIQASGSAAAVTINPTVDTQVHLGGISLTNGASATLTSLGTARSLANYRVLILGSAGATTAPQFNIDPTSTLDLCDNDMAILYGSGASPLAAVQADVLSAFDNRQWDKPGLTSSAAGATPNSTALGFAEATAVNLTTFDNIALGGNALLVKFTTPGDANLDGSVDLSDYTTVLNNLGSTGLTWSDGNFDYAGTVGLSDYSKIIANFGSSGYSASFTPAKVTAKPAKPASAKTTVTAVARK